MADDNSSQHEELLQRFPNLTPIKGTPTLFTMNGFGVSVYGKRDYDEQTNTYVKTHCLCFIFIPVLALGAYRVADAERGWYFIGKEPLSGFARTWNKIVAVLAILLVSNIAWSIHTSSPEYQSAQKMKEGKKLMEEGAYVRAANVFRPMVTGPNRHAEAREELQKALEAGLNAGGDKAVSSYQLLSTLPATFLTSQPIIPEPLERGLKLAQQVGKDNPSDGLLVLEAARRIAPTNEQIATLQQDLLLAGTVKSPGDLKYLEPLAVIYEEQDRAEDCVPLLQPHKDKLGQSECARILGQQFMAQNQYNDAYALLYPYVQGRLATLVSAENTYTNSAELSYKAAIKHLNDGKAEESFYRQYDRANEAGKDTLVDEFVRNWMNRDAGYQRAIAQFREANRIVPVTLDLGIVQLNRAQSLSDPSARKAELEAAEKTFLAIRGSAGESDEYRLFLGQVYYWLGRANEGKTLFDALLASRQRALPTLTSLAYVYRDVGDEHQARELLEEAYRAATTDKDRFQVAAARARVQKDLDDEILWLQKSDTSDLYVKVSLHGSRARKALTTGDRKTAAAELKQAVSGYAKMGKTSATLNNWGLAQLSLFAATGNLEDYRKGVQMMEESISLDPSNSILLRNLTSVLLSEALMEVSGDKFHFMELGETLELNMLSELYRDEAEQKQLMDRLRANEAMKKCAGYLDRALVLSPKSVYLYQTQLTLTVNAEDLAELKKLQQRVHSAQLDFTQTIKEAQENLSTAKSAEMLEHLQDQIKRVDGLIREAGANGHAPTLAHLQNRRDSLVMGTRIFGEKVDFSPLLTQAKKNHAVLDSYASLLHLEAVYLQLAGEELARAHAEFSMLQKQTQRFLSSRELCLLLLDKGGPVAEAIRRNSNVLAAVEIEKERARRFATNPSPNRWAFMRHFEASLADSIRQGFLASELMQLETALDAELDPMDASSVLDLYWSHLMSGRTAEAEAAYQAGVTHGLALPKLGKLKI